MTVSTIDRIRVYLGGGQAAEDAGTMRLEGRDYRVCDGDVMVFRFSV